MSSCEALDAHNESGAGYEMHGESKLFEDLIWLDRVAQDNQDAIEAEETVRQKTAWRLRISKREVRMFRLRRAGELAMSTTIAPLSIYAAVQSLSEGRIEGAAISVMGIFWSLGVGRVVVQDFNSAEYLDLVNNTAQERMYHDTVMASLEGKPEL